MLGPAKWTYYYLYVILDVFSRYAVGWMVAHRELASLAQRLIGETCERQGIEPGQLGLHADRGSSMTSKPVAFRLADLGVTKTHSRPHDPKPRGATSRHQRTGRGSRVATRPFAGARFRPSAALPQFRGESSLHDDKDQKVFASVVAITDRQSNASSTGLTRTASSFRTRSGPRRRSSSRRSGSSVRHRENRQAAEPSRCGLRRRGARALTWMSYRCSRCLRRADKRPRRDFGLVPRTREKVEQHGARPAQPGAGAALSDVVDRRRLTRRLR